MNQVIVLQVSFHLNCLNALLQQQKWKVFFSFSKLIANLYFFGAETDVSFEKNRALFSAARRLIESMNC